MSTYIKKQLRKATRFSGILFVVLCILTFIFRAPMKVFATNLNNVGTNTTDTQSKDTEETKDDGAVDISGVIGPFGFRLDTGSESNGLSATLQILLLLTIISLAPAILIMVTSFTRILIVMHFVRSALGTQSTPPNQVLIGLALFLTVFIMSPVFTQINNKAIQPLQRNEITTEEAIEAGIEPLREFMLKEVKPKDLKLFMDIAEIGPVDDVKEIPITVIIPSFIISELRIAFIIGFVIYIPFIVIDMVVASTLMSMGMMMLPPTTISMPFKILLFILVDGWGLIIEVLLKTFI